MTTLIFLLALLIPMDETEQLQTYIRVNFIPISREELESQIGISCDIFPKTLTVGDMLYINVTTKNISQRYLKYALRPNTLGRPNINGEDGLSLRSATIHRSRPVELANASFGYIARSTDPAPGRPRNDPTGTLQPGNTIPAYVKPLLVPTPDQYDRPLWIWNDFGKEEKVLLTFNTGLSSVRTEGTGISTVERSDSYGVEVIQELKIKPRPQEELALIKEWYEKTQKFWNIWQADSPTPDDWREFEEQLTPGTLRNHVRMLRTLVEIAQDENKGNRRAMFVEMLEWIDELHPLESQGLTKRAYEIVAQQYRTLGKEITIPVMPNDKDLLK